MPLYRIVRSFGRITDAELADAGVRAVACAARFPGVTWQRSYFDPAAVALTCFYEAPDEASIRRHAEAAGLPCDSVTRVLEFVPRT